ncbi:hypothetical protein PVAND_004712 [Polypedilum vanderplanki]|uniref:Sodium/potassium-transporting ATPase subunit beta-2 n=1 Tax=Polypedilum vanderplanki TaxID=319348 RepID=A0A9J6BYD7_POLVA|nr:hypothetical protein PVAND_004712 [Polypedilum vanderplanki]
MCLKHPCYERLNRIAASKPLRIFYGVILFLFVAFACYRLLQASNDLHAQKNARLEVIPNFQDNFIKYEVSSGANDIVAKINDALIQYETPNKNRQRCDNSFPSQNKSCDVDLNEFGPCTKENGYGYYRGSPCVFIKLKKLENWIPQCLNNSNPLPDDMPIYLKNYISNDHNRNQRAIWLSCSGEKDVDVEYVGKIEYYPSYGFPIYYFPSKNDESYLEPLIAVEFVKPQRGIAIFIKCKVWAQNLVETTIIKLSLD